MTAGSAGAVPVPSLRARAFHQIFTRNRWNGTETRSGPGSTLGSTARLAAELPTLLALLEATSVLDAACGASFWMPDLPGYVGVDIVPDAIAVVQERFPDRHYFVADIVSDALPPSDVVIARDVLAHLPNRDVLGALANFRSTGARYLLLTTFDGADNSVDARAGGYHELDLTQPPFSLGEPLRKIADGYWEDALVYPTKQLGVFVCTS